MQSRNGNHVNSKSSADSAALQVERAALGLLRVVGRLLAYKESADSLVNSLQLLPKMRTQLAWDLSPKTTTQVSQLGMELS